MHRLLGGGARRRGAWLGSAEAASSRSGPGLVLYRVGLFTVAAVVCLVAVKGAAQSLLPVILVMTGLVVLGDAVRVRNRVSYLGFEAVPIFAGVIILNEPAVAIVPAFCGILGSRLIEAIVTRQFTSLLLVAPAQACLAYGVAAAMHGGVLAIDRSYTGRIGGMALLIGGYLLSTLVLSRAHRVLSGKGAEVSALAEAKRMGRSILLLLPFVGLQVMLHPVLRQNAAPATFVAVLVLAYLKRRESTVQRRNDSLTRQNRELSLIRRSQQRFMSAEGEEETLRRLFVLANDLFPVSAFAAVVWERGPHLPGAVYRFGSCDQPEQGIVRWLQESRVMDDAPREALIRSGASRDIWLCNQPGLTQVVIAMATVEVVHGLLIFESPDPVVGKAETLSVFQQLVAQAAAVHQEHLLSGFLRARTSELSQHRETLSEILKVSQSLITNVDTDAILTDVAKAVQDALGSQAVVISLREQGGDLFVPSAHAGLDEVWEEVRQRSEAPEAMERFLSEAGASAGVHFIPAKTLWSDDTLTFFKESAEGVTLQDWSALDMIVVPLRHDDEVIGYLAVRERTNGQPPSEDKEKVLEIFADLTAAALKSARQYKEIESLAEKDALTSAYNHRYFQEQLRREVQRHERSGQRFGLLMLDLDNFKRMNDSLGHPAGDEILKTLVAELRANVREVDSVCRYGGEEFAIILPQTPQDGVLAAAERIRSAIESRRFTIADGPALEVTVSCGVAMYPSDGESAASLVAKADAALYVAKRTGRNRVIAA